MTPTTYRLRRWALLVLALALLPLGQLVSAATAQASDASDIGSVCLLRDGTLSGCAPMKLPSPGLLNPHYLGSDETRAAMHRLENEAIDITLEAHELPASDREAVKSWGRQDAQAVLWGLIVGAIMTPTNKRTADQRAAVTWIASMDASLKARAGRNAGLEYTKWAGLSVKHYSELVNSNAGVDELTDFLHSSVEGSGSAAQGNPSGGYCHVQAAGAVPGRIQRLHRPDLLLPLPKPVRVLHPHSDIRPVRPLGSSDRERDDGRIPCLSAGQHWSHRSRRLRE
ncbi:MAG: hypothetical protein QM747_21610 [Nocardioides sp.]